jgi:hypothetical protein
MKTYHVTTKVVMNGDTFVFSQTYRSKTYSSVAKRALQYIEKTCPDDFADATQIAMRIKRRLT